MKNIFHTNYKIFAPFKKFWSFLEEKDFYMVHIINYALAFSISLIAICIGWYIYEFAAIGSLNQNAEDTSTAFIASLVLAFPLSFFYHKFQMKRLNRELEESKKRREIEREIDEKLKELKTPTVDELVAEDIKVKQVKINSFQTADIPNPFTLEKSVEKTPITERDVSATLRHFKKLIWKILYSTHSEAEKEALEELKEGIAEFEKLLEDDEELLQNFKDYIELTSNPPEVAYTSDEDLDAYYDKSILLENSICKKLVEKHNR